MHPIPQSASDAASCPDADAALIDVMMHGMRQLAELHLGLIRVTMEQCNIATRWLWSARDATQFLTLATEQLRPNAQRTFDYSYYLTTIAANTVSGVIRAVGGNASGSTGVPRRAGM